VRESLGFEEFQEALVQLKEEKDGRDPSSRNFDLPDMSPKGDDEQWGDWRRWRQWQPPTEGGDASVDQEGDQSPTSRGDGYRLVPSVEPDMSPKAASEHGRTVPPASQPGSTQHGSPIPGVLGPLDSFILEVLRGWRLLVAASPSNEEWRDVLAATGNKLDYISISNSLRHAMMGQRAYMNNWHEQWDVSLTGIHGVMIGIHGLHTWLNIHGLKLPLLRKKLLLLNKLKTQLILTFRQTFYCEHVQHGLLWFGNDGWLQHW
jgi:hypothetical protein